MIWLGFLVTKTYLLFAFLVLAILLAAPTPWSLVTRVQACDPNAWALYSRAFLVEITELSTDKASYQPGETVSVLGTVRLVEQDTYYQDGCDPPYQQGQPFADNPNVVAVTLQSSLGSDTRTVSDSGAFIFNIALAPSTKAGTYSFTVNANCVPCADIGQTSGDSKDGSFGVQAYSPTLAVNPSTAYPGDTVTVSGSGWGSADSITLTYGLGGTATVSGPLFSQEIMVPAVNEGPATILASQGSPPYLTQTTHVDVKWHTLALTATITSGQVVQGTAATITGVVTREDGKPLGTTIIFIITPLSFGSQGGNAISNPDGTFTITLNTKDATPQTYDIKLSTDGKFSHLHDAVPVHLSLTVNPPPPPISPLSLAAAAAGTGLGLGAGAAANKGTGDKSDEEDRPGKRKMYNFRFRPLLGFSGKFGVGVGIQAVEIQEMGGEHPGMRKKFYFAGAGLYLGAGVALNLTSDEGKDFITDTPVSLDSFGGFGGIGYTPAIAIIGNVVSFQVRYRFGNGVQVSTDASALDASTIGLQAQLGGAAMGCWL